MGGGRVLIVLCCALLLAGSALGVSIGVNKGVIRYDDVLQNGYAEERVLVTTDSDAVITGTYQVDGEIAPWVRIEPVQDYFNFSSGRPHQLRIIVEPPADAQIRGYTGGVRVLTGEVARSAGGLLGTSTRAAFYIRVSLGLTGTQILECVAGGIRLKDTEIGDPVEFVASVQNQGNVRVTPDFTVRIYDQYQERILEEHAFVSTEEILPTTTGEIVRPVVTDLPVGQYWAVVESPLCSGGALITFDVLEPGGISDQGELLRIDAQTWAKTGDIIEINGVFRNQGSRTVNAKLTGTVTRQDSERIYKVIDTDPVAVPPGATVRIPTFFNPVEPGQYVVAGRVLYNRKLTFQKSAILNVNGAFLGGRARLSTVSLLLIAIVIAILVLLILITRQKRGRRHGRRR